MRTWWAGYSCSANLNTKRGYNWTNKADPFGTYLYVKNVLAGNPPPPPPPPPPGGNWVMTATGTCTEGQSWHWQCSVLWVPAADIPAQGTIATCKVTNGTVCGNTAGNRYWMKVSNLQPTTYVMSCNIQPPTLTSRTGCPGSSAVVSYVQLSTSPPPPPPPDLSGWVMSATGTCTEGQSWHWQCSVLWVPAADPRHDL
jgi:hypothetical protein